MKEEEDFEYADDFGPIPELFYSDLTNAPFQECTMCKRSLLEENTSYLIEKAFRVNQEFGVKETVFEYAICWECADGMKDAMSAESMMNLQRYFMQHGKLIERRQRLLQQKTPPQLEQWVGNCLFKGTDREQLSEYQVFGQFEGEHLLYHETPYLISGAAIDEMQELLSQKTRDEMDGFLDNFTDLPPELKKALEDGKLVIM